jgi:4-hydroxybenzoate polyprenyltransferase
MHRRAKPSGKIQLMSVARSFRLTLQMIKWEHSIFALPFALAGAMLAAAGLPAWRQLGWILVAMVAARSAAMAFNRLVDHSLDAANPRTRARALPAGLLSRQFVGGFVVLSCAIFVLAAGELNRLALVLSPVALAILLLYSYTKRFTRWSHLILGFADGISAPAGWIAVRGSLDWRIVILAAAITFWVGGFDVLYACQDCDFDRQTGLHSIPRFVGIRGALWVARAFHVLMIGLLLWLVFALHLGMLAIAGVAVVGALLAYEHSLVSHRDLSRLDAAFFTMNGVISVVYFLSIAADLMWRR